MTRTTPDGGVEAVFSQHGHRLGPTIKKYIEMGMGLEGQDPVEEKTRVLEDIVVDALMHVDELGHDQTDFMARVDERVTRLIECKPDPPSDMH